MTLGTNFRPIYSVAVESPLEPDLDLLFARHTAHCLADTPPESMHMMDRSGMDVSGITFLVLRNAGTPIAMGALKRLDQSVVELKSMHVLSEARGTGAAGRILEALIEAARDMGAAAIRLETGTQDSFAAARALYYRAGFTDSTPFADYREDPNSVYMVLHLKG